MEEARKEEVAVNQDQSIVGEMIAEILKMSQIWKDEEDEAEAEIGAREGTGVEAEIGEEDEADPVVGVKGKIEEEIEVEDIKMK